MPAARLDSPAGSMVRFGSMNNRNRWNKFTGYMHQGAALIVSPILLFPVRLAPKCS